MKKKTFLSILVILISYSSSWSQSFSVSNTDTTFYGNITDTDFDAKFVLSNDSTTSFPMTWQVESATIEPGWQYSVCDPSACHGIGTTTFDFNMPTSSINRIMNLHYYPNGNAGQSSVTVRLFQQDMPNDYVLLTWTGIISTAGMNEQTDFVNLMIYPNPSTNGQISVNYSANTAADFILFNELGQEINRFKISENETDFDINIDSGSGVYFYKVISRDKILTENKIIIL